MMQRPEMGLCEQVATLELAPSTSFPEALAFAQRLQRGEAPDRILAACRTLLRALPPSVPPTAAQQLAALGTGWLAPPQAAPGQAAGGAAPAAVVQLQAEATHLILAIVAPPSKAKLPAAAARQLLQAVCRACRHPAQPADSVAAQELACGCMDLLAQLQQWYPQPPKAELAEAVAAVAAVLDRQAAGGGREETAAATRLLCKLLRALQALLAEAKKEHGTNAAGMALYLQHLFTYGWQQRASSSGGSAPRRGSSMGGVAPPAASGRAGGRTASQASVPGPASPLKYRPPHARSSTADEQPAARSLAAAAPQGAAHGAAPCRYESSDSESSDAEGSGVQRHRASRVRSGALACLQLLAKADPRSLHSVWTQLLPTSDVVSSRSGRGASAGAVSVAHLLLHDPDVRVRHAAAATIATLLEGPAQRAYLAVAEAKGLERPPVRGFTTLSASLGQMLVALHAALLHSVQHEADPLALAAALRALGTLLLGAPYHRLPPQLLPLCVRGLAACLAKATPSPPAGVASLPPEQLPVALACLTCLAAAFSCKAPAPVLAEQLVPAPAARCSTSGGGEGAGGGSNGTEPRPLLDLLFGYAACQQPALQLEAVMALRGVAQQHMALLQGCWEQLLAIGRAGAALPPAVPQSPRAQAGAADGTLPEKVAQQSVRLPGDYLQSAAQAAEAQLAAASSAVTPEVLVEACAAAQQEAAQWQQVADSVLAGTVQHSSPLLRAAAQGVIGGMTPAAYTALPLQLKRRLLGWCCSAAAADEASPVRAAAAKALGALAAAPALCSVPGGPSQALGALTASCGDAVLAVRLQTAAALAAFCGMLAAAAAPAAAAEALPGCLRLAVGAAAAGNEKVRPSGLQALGSLLDMCGRLPSEVPAAGDAAQLLAAAAAAVQDSLGSGNAARVQWAACEAAGQLLACSAAATQQHVAATVRQLLALLRECPNFRSRALAAAALRRLPSLAPAADASGGPEGLLDAVAAVLFQGKAVDFAPTPPPAAPSGQQQQRQQQQQQAPAELGSRAQLESALVAAVLHLLALLPSAAAVEPGALAPSAARGAGQHPGRRSSQLGQLRLLVAQAQREVLAPHDADAGAGAAACEAAAAVPAVYFDLSQVSPELAADAARGLVLMC